MGESIWVVNRIESMEGKIIKEDAEASSKTRKSRVANSTFRKPSTHRSSLFQPKHDDDDDDEQIKKKYIPTP